MESIEFDKELLKTGKYIAGIDEVGRGCLFGDVVSACVIMPLNDPIEGIKDSKKISEKKREIYYNLILDKAIAIGIGQVCSKDIDEINIRQATRMAMKEAILNLKNYNRSPMIADLYLIDAETVDLDINQKSIIHGDNISYSIACASIIAKVFRDKLCLEWDKKYPQYGLAKNKGYGTKSHREAILKYGASNLHRQSFLRKIIKI